MPPAKYNFHGCKMTGAELMKQLNEAAVKLKNLEEFQVNAFAEIERLKAYLVNAENKIKEISNTGMLGFVLNKTREQAEKDDHLVVFKQRLMANVCTVRVIL